MRRLRAPVLRHNEKYFVFLIPCVTWGGWARQVGTDSRGSQQWLPAVTAASSSSRDRQQRQTAGAADNRQPKMK